MISRFTKVPSSIDVRQCLAALGAVVLLASCIQPVKTPPSQVAVPGAFQEQASQGAPTTAGELSRWWTVWHEEPLAELITAALVANTDIRTAQAHVAEARAMVTVAESALYPAVAAQGAVFGGAADWRLPNSIPGLPVVIPTAQPGFWGGWGALGASWEPDVFGRHRADLKAAQAISAASVDLLNGARVTVVADVAENYYEARGLQLRLDVLDRGIATLEDLLNYTQARYQAGQAYAYDADLVREQLDTQRAKRPPLLALIEARRRRLAVLTGKPPEAAVTLPQSTPINVPSAPTGLLPVQALERRPDVQEGAALVEASAARLRSAKTDLLPRFGIQFLGGDAELHFQGLPNFGATGGLLNLSAYLPVFTHGRIRANIAANDARLEAAAAEYDTAVLKALEDVENAYRQRTALDERSVSLASALAAARRNQEASTTLYEDGRKTFRDVLDDRITALNDEDELVQSQMGQATATVQLYRALGGGW